MREYLDLLTYIEKNGHKREDRTGTGTISVFGYQMKIDLNNRFPLLTTKKVNFHSIAYELLWFLRGDTNIQFLAQNNVNIWNEWSFQIYLEKNNLIEKFPRYSDEWKLKLNEFVEQIK